MTETPHTGIDTTDLPFKKRLILYLAPIAVAGLVRFLYRTNRNVDEHVERWDAMNNSGTPFLVPVFHENAAVVLPYLGAEGFHALVSQSYDGEIATRLLARFGIGAIRGSSSKGGRAALEAAVKHIPSVRAFGLAVDGPRGPRRKVKPGIVLLSQRTQLPIFPIASIATRSWRVRSWDRMCIPKPFGTYVVLYGEAIEPAADGDRETIDAKIAEVETVLNTLQEDLEARYGINAYLD